MASGGKRALGVWHRRSGKDEVCLHWAAICTQRRPATYWHMLPEYAQGRKAIWAAVNPHTGKRRIDEAFPKEIRASTNEQEMFIRFKNGATWQVVGSDNFNSTVGSPPAGVVFSEWALSNPAAYGYLAPILVENDGWAMFITTSRGRNHCKSMLDMARTRDDWFAEVLSADDTGAISKTAIEVQRVEYAGIFGQEAADSLIEQEYYCSFDAAVLGSYWGKELRVAEAEGRIGRVPVNPDLPVTTAWDIGVGDSMAIWCFQVYHDHIDVVDYYENSGLGFDHYCEWLDERGYNGIDYVPHDAKVREPGAPGARSRIQTLIEVHKRKCELVPLQSIADGINAGRRTLPFARFDAVRCKRGLDCLREYKVKWDAKKMVFLDTPDHGWPSHGGSAWRYLSVSWRSPMRPHNEPEPELFRQITELTFDEWRDFGTDDEKAARA